MRNADNGSADLALALDAEDVERRLLIERYLPLVRRIARRFAGREEALDDLVQVGSLALVKAVDRRDAARSDLLPAYLGRCVEGEIRRHLRDRCAVVRVPRRLQRPGGGANGEEAAAPRANVAQAWDEDAEARFAAADELDGVALARVLVSSGARFLESRERRVLLLRYFLDLSQAEIGALEGVSQVQVSRLQHRALAKMRARLAGDPAAPV